ncbi:MAG: hypothetical protein LBP86_03185 [Azoarcus sp.]|jgi:hypothetical protein|nr:hypothetical protein [Azoarcus sp.]
MDVDSVIRQHLHEANAQLGKVLDAEVILLCGPMYPGTDEAVRGCVETLVETRGASSKSPRLCVVLETGGGFIDTVERIYGVLRKHYKEVIFVVPNFAYSAGTVLALSGDEIYMDDYSVLGPIDPQVLDEKGEDYVPGIGYLLKFNQLLNAVNKSNGVETHAEMSLLLSKFDQAKLFFIEQSRDHAVELLKAWLPKHKFKNWVFKEHTQEPVTDDMKQKRAEEIAACLSDPERWHSHGRGIGIQALTSETIKLKIRNFADEKDLNKSVRDYYDLFKSYLPTRRMRFAIHSSLGIRRLPGDYHDV